MYINNYGELNPSVQNMVQLNTNYNRIENLLISRFVWECGEDEIPYGFIEYGLINNGSVGVFKKGSGELVVVYGCASGGIDDYGRGYEYKGTTFSGTTYEGVIGEDCVVIYNNALRKNNRGEIDTLCYFQNQTDISIQYNLLNCRFNKVFVANDEATKMKLTDIFKKTKEGEPLITTTHNRNYADIFDAQHKQFEELMVTDGRDIDKIQYLSRFHDDLISRFCMYAGIEIPNINKQAQITSDELKSTQAIANLMLDDALRSRVEGVKQINEIFGRSWTVSANVSQIVSPSDEEEEVSDQEETTEGGMTNEEENI